MTKVEINHETRFLNFSIQVMMDSVERFGSQAEMLGALDRDDAEGFEAFRWLLIHMANDGELLLRQQGYDSLAMLTEDDVTMRMSPMTHARLLQAVVEEYSHAVNKEYTEDEEKEIDLGLAELRKKKETPA